MVRKLGLILFAACFVSTAQALRADADAYLLIPRYERGQRWVEVSQYAVEFHSSVQAQNTIPIAVSVSERSKAFFDVLEADAVQGDFRKLDCRFEYAYQEVVPPNRETKKIVNLPVHARTVHLNRRFDDLGTARMEVQIDGAPLTPEVEGRFRSRFANRSGVMPTQPVRVGEAWTVSQDAAIESVFGERANGTLQMQFDSIDNDEVSGKRCAIVKYTGDVVVRIPNVPGKDPRSDWEKRADKWNDREFQPIGGHGAATDYLHISGVIWIDLETRRPVRHAYSGTVEDDPDPTSPTNAKGTQIARQHGDVKFEWRSKPAPPPDAIRDANGNIDGLPALATFKDPQHRFEVGFPPTWAANRDGGDQVKIVPGGETSIYALIRAERVAPGTTPEAAYEKLVAPRVVRLPNFVGEPAQPMELGGRAAVSTFYRFSASEDLAQPGTKFSASVNVAVADDWAFVIECVAPIDRFPDVAPQFADLIKSLKFSLAAQPAREPRQVTPPQREAEAPAAYRDQQERFHLLDLTGFRVANDAAGDDLLVLRPVDAAAQDVEIRIRLERGQSDPRAVVQRLFRRAAEMGEAFEIVHEGQEGTRYIAVVSRGAARQRIEVMPARAEGEFLILTASAPSLDAYRKFADVIERILQGCRP